MMGYLRVSDKKEAKTAGSRRLYEKVKMSSSVGGIAL